MQQTDFETVSGKTAAILDVMRFNPRFTLLIIVLGVLSATMQGIGLSFLFPIIENIQSPEKISDAGGALNMFTSLYDSLGIPFTLGNIIFGAILILTLRYSAAFIFGWLQQALRSYYIRDLQERMFDTILAVHPSEYDNFQSDQVLNDIITETYYAGRVIQRFTSFFEIFLLTLVYFVIAFSISSKMTVVSFSFLIFVGAGLVFHLESGYELGNRVAQGNAKRHEIAQTTVQNLREIRLFGSESELRSEFQAGVNRFTNSRILLRRNQNAIKYTYELTVAISVLVLLYLGLTVLELPVSLLVLYLVVMAEIGPSLSSLHLKYYQIQNDLPHLVWVQQFMDRVPADGNELDDEPDGDHGQTSPPETITRISFTDVTFSYDQDKYAINEQDRTLDRVSLDITAGEAVAIVGDSGVGKSTFLSLLAGIYEPESGVIYINDRQLNELCSNEWYKRIAFVRQDPPMFHETLESNLTIGNRQVSKSDIERVCKLTCLDEVISKLPHGYETILGDEGARLSGGQRQRVALARALLRDPDLLLLDEATSKLNKKLEEEILSAISNLGITIISVTPRIPPKDYFDRICKFSDIQQRSDTDSDYSAPSAAQSSHVDGDGVNKSVGQYKKYNNPTVKQNCMSNEGNNKSDMNRRNVLKLVGSGAAVAGGFGQFSEVASAQEGQKLGEISFPSTGSAGVSNTFNGEFLMVVDGYTTNEIDIYEPSPQKDAVGTHIATKILPVDISGATWDHTRGRLWATEGRDGEFYLIDIGDQTESEEIDPSAVETRFTLSQQGWPADGLAYDGESDSIWWTYDGSNTVWQVDTDGTIENEIVPERTENGEDFIHHSGIAVGKEKDGRKTLYLGDNAEEVGENRNYIVRVFADNGENITTYADVPFRVEDIACDPVTYGDQEAIIVKDANNNKSTTFRVEDGTCPVASGSPDYTVLQEALDQFESAYKSLMEAHFRGQGAHEAVLYHEYGEAYANRLVDYWGYKTGVVSDEEVTDGTRELADASLEMIRDEVGFEYDDTDAEILYEFYDELFSKLEAATTLAERKQIAEEYYVGEYEGQNTALTFDDGKTIADGFSEDWELRTDIIDELTADGELTQDQIQRAATGLTERSERLRARGEEIVESMVAAAKELEHQFEDTQKEVQARTFETESAVETDEVDTEIEPASAILIGTALAAIVSFGAGYVVSKCGTAGAAAQMKGVEFETVDISVTPEDNAAHSAVMTGISLGQITQEIGAAISSEGNTQTEPESVFGAWVTGNFVAGAKAGAYDVGLTGAELFAQAGFAQFADAQIRNLSLPDIDNETQVDPLNSFVGGIKQFIDDLPVVGDWVSFGPPTNGKATGSIEIENTGSVPFRPTFEVDYRLRNDRDKFNSAYKVEIDGGDSVIGSNDGPKTYDITYQVPTDEGFLTGELDVSLGMSPESIVPTEDAVIPVSICELDYNAIEADTAKDQFTVQEEVMVETIAEDTISEGDVKSTEITPDPDLQSVTAELDYDGYTTDLLVSDTSGNRTGYDYQSGTEINEIPGATYSGRATDQGSNEWVTLQQTDETYTIETSAPALVAETDTSAETHDQETTDDSPYEEMTGPNTESTPTVSPTDALTSSFTITTENRPELAPKLSTTPTDFRLHADQDDQSITGTLVIQEVNGDQAAEDVSLTTTPLTHEDGNESILPDAVTFTSDGVTVADSQAIEITVALPDEPKPGNYNGTLSVESTNTDSISCAFRVVVETAYDITTYAGPEGKIGPQGLGNAARDYRNGKIDPQLLGDVARAFRTNERVM
ncbi:ATP-binding cassette domain-containing protein [Halonotius roseus]|uniref:ATP-binding cassette domain-containing protein n=1 Tax=Halonotius roseus TaxID=2511997 RepID=A0A544QRG7_9EURY|nr:ATP-binding cassette domain-containing protein [Halonotius roseus]TQQ82043.1 ATP-binding cassette domain-containing protein [Halonotius roseus]